MKRLLILMILPIAIITEDLYSQTSQVDSLEAILDNLKEDTSRVNTLNELCRQLYRTDPEKTIRYGREANNLADQLNYQKGIARSFNLIGLGFYMQGNFVNAAVNWEQSLELFMSLNDEKSIARVLGNLGSTYGQFGDDVKAIEYLLQSLQIAENLNDSFRIATCLLNIGGIYSYSIENLDKAVNYYSKALTVSKSIDYLDGIGVSYFNLGDVFFQQAEYDSALINFENSLLFFESNIDISASLNSIGNTYAELGEFHAAIEFHIKALEIAQSNNFQLEEAQILIGLAGTYGKQGYPRRAISYYEQAKEIAEKIGSKYDLKEIYEGLAYSHEDISNYQEAFRYLSLLNDIERTLFNIETEERIGNLMHSFELDKKENEIKILEQNSEIDQLKAKRQRVINIATGSIGILLLMLSGIYYNRLQYARKTNVKINAQREEIESQRDEIEAQRDEVEAQRDQLEVQRDLVVGQKNEIIDSIKYAHRIQTAMLPPESYVTELLNENFIYYKPRDIVSGDFYWIKQVNQYVILVAADCTGHGVPGAFMSLLGISYLNEIIQRREITQANQVLNELRKQIKHSLRQHGQRDESKDGIDMALCVMDLKSMKMQFSGANNPLYLIKDVNGKPEFKEIKADRMPLGYYQGKDVSFVNHDIQLGMGDTFYIFSDGFIDQKGGQDNKKFMSKNFKNLLLEIHDQPMYDQKDILDKAFAEWMGRNSQLDDVLIVGVRV